MTTLADDHRTRFLQLALHVQALRFGSFTLKSGRVSPYFFDAGRFDSGAALVELARCYADAVEAADASFDVLFGPAYKGIPLATALACEFARRGHDMPVAFDRKEAKTHGEGGRLIGASLQGRRALIVDDVITAGTAVGEAVAHIRHGGGEPAGVVVALDRQERLDPDAQGQSAAQAVAERHGMPVIAVARLEDLLGHVQREQVWQAHAAPLQAYRARFGVADVP